MKRPIKSSRTFNAIYCGRNNNTAVKIAYWNHLTVDSLVENDKYTIISFYTHLYAVYAG